MKNTITISEIIAHFCPIFNEISAYSTDSFEAYREFFLNLEMENYLAMIVKKTSLEGYKDMYVTGNESLITRRMYTITDIYDYIFRPILHEVNLTYSDPIEVAYILTFSCKFCFSYKPSFIEI